MQEADSLSAAVVQSNQELANGAGISRAANSEAFLYRV